MANRLTASVLGCSILLVLSGCASSPQRIEVSASPIPKPELVLPQSDRISSRPVEWIVVTPENYQEVFDKLSKSGRPIVLFALTDKGYENISLNLSDIRAFMQQQKAIIAAYENYYKASEEALNKANEQVDSVNSTVKEANTKKESSKSIFNFFK
jgi:hypothetical protein